MLSLIIRMTCSSISPPRMIRTWSSCRPSIQGSAARPLAPNPVLSPPTSTQCARTIANPYSRPSANTGV
jgi:hypothetical protein